MTVEERLTLLEKKYDNMEEIADKMLKITESLLKAKVKEIEEESSANEING